MLLNLNKEDIAKIKFFKSRRDFYLFFVFFGLILSNFGISLKEGEFSFFKDIKSKIQVKINYFEPPSTKDFFSNTVLEKYIAIVPLKELNGIWEGTFSLNKNSVFWTNQNFEKHYIYSLISFGPYGIYLKFNNPSTSISNKLSGLEVVQEDVQYDSVNIELANDKQINYWAKAHSKKWFEIVRGKILRINDNELFMEFQTTVYEKKIPIYAFRDRLVLRRVTNGKR